MFGLFRASPILSGGLLWKVPFRISSNRKLRHRRRLRRVDNIVTVLDSALRRAFGPAQAAKNTVTAQREESQAELQAKRLGRGPKRGDLLPLPGEEDGPAPGTVANRPIRTTGQAARENGTIKGLERWKADMPREEEMRAKDKYTIFDRKVRSYRKGIHKLPKWTRIGASQRLNPPGF